MFSIPNVIYANLYTGLNQPPDNLPYHIVKNNITKAIERATPGGIVYIEHKSGDTSYTESTIRVNKSVRIIGVPDGEGHKPRIENSGGGPVFNVTNMSFDSDFDFCKFDKTIYFDSSDISEGSSGIYVSYNYNKRGMLKLIPPGNNVFINISNCDIHDNTNGISLNEDYVNVTNCDIIDNEVSGINLSESDSNNIFGCHINSDAQEPSKTMDGIVIADGSNNNEIKNCNILYKRNGIHIIDSDDNDIDWCLMERNGNGTYIEGDSENNDIRSCDIKYNAYGIYITGAATNNVIHHNDFINTNNANSESSPNRWDNNADEGNYWSDYDGKDDDGSWDGVGDTPYDIPGGNNQDRYPLGATWKTLDGLRTHSVDFWNPYGESIILLTLNMEAYEEKTVYLYYGNSSNLSFQIHKFSDTAIFFDDFNNINTWKAMGNPKCEDGFVVFNQADYIITEGSSPFSLEAPSSPIQVHNSASSNEMLYVVEARTKLGTVLQETQGNMILLNQFPTGIAYCYLISNHVVPGQGNYLKMNKQALSNWYELDNTSLPSLLDHWQRMIAQVYLGKHLYSVGGEIKRTNATKISVNLYDFTSYNLEGNISDTDGWIGDPPDDPPDEDDYIPYMSGSIGLGCGLNDSSTGNFTVDWIRVRKAPVTQPSIIIGAPESKNYMWMNPMGSQNSLSNDPYRPGPLLRDLHEGDDSNIFLINDLPIGTYTITIVSGNNDDSRSSMEITFNDQHNSMLSFDATDAGKFNTKSITIVKNTGEGTALTITFDKINVGDTKPWTVNAITIERGDGGVTLS